MGPHSIVIRSAFIDTRDEAVAYFLARVAGTREVTIYDRTIELVIPTNATHLYSETVDAAPLDATETIIRSLGRGRVETRRFSLDRARHMDLVVHALRNYVVSLPGSSARENFQIFGPVLADGSRHMKVVVQRVAASRWTCLSAFPVGESAFRDACRSRRARWP